MLALEICLSAALIAISSLVAFIWLANTREVSDLANQLEKCEDTLGKAIQLMGVIEERINGHLKWSAEVFTPFGGQRTRGGGQQ